MKNRLDLAVFIVFYEKLEQTIECISSFLPSGVQIYVLNNGSSISSRQLLGKYCNKYEQIKIYDSNVNLGPGGGRNYLITHTVEEWLLSVDNDIVMRTDNWVKIFIKHITLNNDMEVFIPRLFAVHTNRYAIPYSYKIEQNIAFPDEKIVNDITNTFPGGASFISRKLFNRLGLYDEKLFALEEFDLSLRGIISGKPIKAKVIYDIELAHEHRPATNKGDRKAVIMRYNMNNIEKSYQRIADKYGIVLEDRGKIGSIYNLEYMLYRYNPLSRYFWKRLVPKPIKRKLRDIEAKIRRRVDPTFCNLFMTEKCNFKCPGCRRSVVGIGKSKEMTLPTVQRLLSLYPSITRFCVAGSGEPTLCTHFVAIVDFLKRSKKSVGIITNGTNISKFHELNYDPDYISISLYGYNNESYLNYTGKGIFDKIIENFKNLKDKFKEVGFSFIVDKRNYKVLDRVLRLCDAMRPDFLDLHNYLAYDPDNREEVSKIITVKDKEVISYIDTVCNGRSYRINKPVIVDSDNPPFRCRSYTFLINLDGDGNIGGCQRQIPPALNFGNIFTDNDPYNSPEMLRLRRRMSIRSYYIHKECTFCFGNFCDVS
jgi:MoaA/NifB/PqqE/SkfB family radical SAM enzyme/GT2 family glycosyltransferase